MEKVNIEQIVEGYHPRQEFSGKDELKRSIESEGLQEPITIRRKDERYILIDGLRRLQVIRELGWEEVECHVEDADEKKAAHLSWAKNTKDYRKNLNPMEEAQHLLVMRNRFGYSVKELVALGYAGHQDTIYKKLSLLNLQQEVQDQITAGEVKPSVGYHLAKLKDNPEAQIKLAADESFRNKGAESKVKKRVRAIKEATRQKENKPVLVIPEGEIPGVFFKDARDMSELADESVSLIMTSPPYMVGMEYETDTTLEDHLQMMSVVLAECGRVSIPGGHIALNFGDIHNFGSRNDGPPEIFLVGHHYQEMLRRHGIRLVDKITWEKPPNWPNNPQVSYSDRIQHASYRFLINTESIWIFKKDGDREVRMDQEYQSKISKEEWKTLVNSVWKISPVSSQEGHPAQFPEEIPRRLIKMFSYVEDVVLDPFLGSGTTIKVARELGRVGIGYERDEKYKPVIMGKLGVEVLGDDPQSDQKDIPVDRKTQVDSSKNDLVEKINKLTTSLAEQGKDVSRIKSITIPYSPEDDTHSKPVLEWDDEPDDDPDDDGTGGDAPRPSSKPAPHQNTVLRGDCFDRLKDIPDNSVDQVVTDPPYGLKFMGKDWDKAVPSVDIWRECYRVLKPGAFAFIMASPRQDLLARMYTNLEAAGFRTDFTSIYWTYASGFPKASNITKKVIARGSEPEQVAHLKGAYGGFQPKPAVEPIIVAMKPGMNKTYVDEALINGKGITWLDDCRIPYIGDDNASAGHRTTTFGTQETIPGGDGSGAWEANQKGRFPANLLISDDILDDGKKHPGGGVGGRAKHGRGDGYGFKPQEEKAPEIPKDNGGYSRFFSLDAWAERNLPFLIVPKPSKSEKDMGCGDLPEKAKDTRTDTAKGAMKYKGLQPSKNNHPTVKPIRLMVYLITMGSRPDDMILDPFAGSGTTCMAAKMLGRRFIGIELSEEFQKIAFKRINSVAWPNSEEGIERNNAPEAQMVKRSLKKTLAAVPTLAEPGAVEAVCAS